MAVQYRGRGDICKENSNHCYLHVPANVVEGDMMIAFIGLDRNRHMTTVPDGWTVIFNSSNEDRYQDCKALWKIASDSESPYPGYYCEFSTTAITVTYVAAFYSIYGRTLEMASYSMDVETGWPGTSDPLIPSLTFDGSNGVLAAMVCFNYAPVPPATVSWPSPMVEIWEHEYDPTFSSSGGYELIPDSGATGTRTLTLTEPKRWTTLGVAIEEVIVPAKIRTYGVSFE